MAADMCEPNGSELVETNPTMDTTTISDENVCAVKVSNLYHSYPTQLLFKSKSRQVLNNCSITVPKGHIYALLGPNGCGKTTLIRCIIDRIRPLSGDITVFGVDSRLIPRDKIGYMPQEMSICVDFTIEENLRYFARLYGMNDNSITDGIIEMRKLLNLPEKSRYVSKLSEGQKRRVSLSIALLHSPQLVILDEPTVGVDPVLRRVIWEYMESICIARSATIIITTHYIEEARSATNVAFMRNGCILEEQNPENLLNKFGCTNLESVFLKLCQINDKETSLGSLTIANANPNRVNRIEYKTRESQTKKFHFSAHTSPLLKKHLLKLIRYKVFISFFAISLPAITVLLFYLVTSRLDDIHFDISIYNEDNPANISLNMIDILETHRFINTIYDTKSAAIESVIDGKSNAAIIILANYSKSFTQLYSFNLLSDSFIQRKLVTEKAFFENKDSALFYLDLSKPQGFLMLPQLLKTYYDLIRSYLSSTGQNPEFISIFNPHWVYGDPSVYGGYLIGACLTLVIFIIPLLLISNSIIAEKNEGILERSLAAGVQIFDYFFTHLVIRVLLLSCKVIMLLICVYPLISDTGRQNFFLMSLMVFVQGLSGISLGLLVSIVSKDDITSALILAGTLVPAIILSGMIWPLESLPLTMQYLACVLPMTTTSGAMSAIVNRGWGLDHFEVWIGYAVNIIYTSIYIALAYVLTKSRILFN